MKSRTAMKLTQAAMDRFHEACRLGSGPRWAAEAMVFRGPRMLAALLGTTREAAIITAAIGQWLGRVADAPRGAGPLCLACEYEFAPPAPPVAFLIIRPRTLDGAGHLIMMIGICARCVAQTDECLLRIAADTMRKMC